jgi:hypothetical protein
MATEQAFGGVVVLCLVVSVMLFFFFFYHLDLVRLGLTTNEKVKMSQLRYFLKRAIAFFDRWLDMRQKGEPFEPSESSLKLYGVKKDWKDAKIKEELENTKADLVKAHTSPYRQDFIASLAEVVFTPARTKKLS